MLRRLRRSFARNSRDDRDLDDEITFHLAAETARRIARGDDPQDAARNARLTLGSAALVKERTRAVWVATWLEQVLQDLRFGSRILTKSPGLSFTIITLVALVIGGNTTIYSIAHGILNKPMPGVHASGLVTVSWVHDDGFVNTHNGHRAYTHFLERGTLLQPIAAFDFQRVTMTHDNGSAAARLGIVSANYFETLGVRLVKGRAFTAEEASGSAGLTAIIAHHVWQNVFQGRDDVVGQPLVLNGLAATVVGVADPAFHGAWLAEAADLWVPLVDVRRERLQPDRSGVAVAMIGRLVPYGAITQAHAELTALWDGLRRSEPDRVDDNLRLRLTPYSATAGGNSLVSAYGHRMLAIFSVVTLLTIAIVCANVANLLIARAVVRQREIALRQSLGAARTRIVRGLLAEGLILSLVAWGAACLFAWWIARAAAKGVFEAEAEGPVYLPALTPDWTVVAYALALAVLCTVAFTVAPTLRTWRQQLLPFLKVGEPGVVQAGSRLSRGLVIVQLAFSVLLLTSAGLAQRSMALARQVDLGFNPDRLLLATVNTAGTAAQPEAHRALLETMRARLASLPGVEAVSYIPGTRVFGWVDFPVQRDRSAARLLANDIHTAPGMFAAFGVPFIAGRDFDQRSTRAAIVTRNLAEALWPGESAVGKTLVAGPADSAVDLDVIGVVDDAYFAGQAAEAKPRYIFLPIDDRPLSPGEATFYLRTRAGGDSVARAIARALREVEAGVPLRLRSLDAEVSLDAAPMRMLTNLLTVFALVSLAIACIGQYAVVAFEGRRRIREFGLRIALGASARQVLSAVIGESFRTTALGLTLGFLFSIAVGFVMARFLYGITATDPLTYAGVFLLLAGASLIACYLPARHAAKVDPLTALRTE
jgi:predicted permease